MSRVSSIVLGTIAILATVSGCQVQASIKTKTRFAEEGFSREDTADWKGQPISIKISGVGVSVNGGVKVVASPSTTKVKATARMLAMAFDEEKSNADTSISEAKNTFTIASDDSGVTVSCGHGGDHGSSNGGDSGCEYIEIDVPAGSASQPLALTQVLSGNGGMTLSLDGATLSNLGANSNGGDISASLPVTVGASYSLVSEKADDITVKLPSSFAADEVILQADADKISLGPFSDVKNGAGAGGRGTPGTGLKSLKVTSKDFAGSTGNVTLAQ